MRLDALNMLRDALPRFINPPWYRTRPTPQEISAFIREIAHVKSEFWIGVQDQYPESKAGDWQCRGNFLESMDEPEPQ